MIIPTESVVIVDEDQGRSGQSAAGRSGFAYLLSEVALNHGHRSVWDGPTLEAVLEEAGFVDAHARKWGESALDPAPDSAMREPESVYAEAVKPS